MSALADQIAEVLRPCSLYGIDVDFLAERVAELFTEELRPIPGSKAECLVNEYGLPVAMNIGDVPLQHRFVSPWTAEETKL